MPEDLSLSRGFIESPDPFRLGLFGEKPSLEAESFVGNLGAKGFMRAVGVGGESSGKTKPSEVGEETDMDILSSFMVKESSSGRVSAIFAAADGRDCMVGPEGMTLLERDAGWRVALLLLLLRYSCILCWKETSTFEWEGSGKLLRSSTDLDQVLRDMLRRSPREPSVSEDGCWEDGYTEFNSNDFFRLNASSATDLYRMMSVNDEWHEARN